jgi:hypothetical protein
MPFARLARHPDRSGPGVTGLSPAVEPGASSLSLLSDSLDVALEISIHVLYNLLAVDLGRSQHCHSGRWAITGSIDNASEAF